MPNALGVAKLEARGYLCWKSWDLAFMQVTGLLKGKMLVVDKPCCRMILHLTYLQSGVPGRRHKEQEIARKEIHSRASRLPTRSTGLTGQKMAGTKLNTLSIGQERMSDERIGD